MKSFSFPGAWMVGALAVGLLSSCASSTYYPQAKDEHAYREAHGGSLRDQLADDESAISQSHTDTRQGLNQPHDQPGVANDGLGWYGYR